MSNQTSDPSAALLLEIAIMTDQNMEHLTLGRRRRHKSPPSWQCTSALPVPRLADHLDTEHGPSDEEGGKEAKRQRSEPTTPISSSSRLPLEYDEVMGITQVDPREAERFEEGLDSEYRDAREEPQDIEKPDPAHVPRFSHGGCGSSSLRECIELLNQTRSNSPAALHSGVKTEKKSNPLQVMSPNVEEEQATANEKASGSIPEGQSLPKDEPQSRSDSVKDEVATPKLEPTAKEELDEQDADGQDSDTLREELQRSRDAFPPQDSEDSLGPEQVADELRRLTEAHAQMTGSTSFHDSRGGATAPDSVWDTYGAYAPQSVRRNRGRTVSPYPLMFRSTIWLEHDQEASARAHEEPIEQLRD